MLSRSLIGALLVAGLALGAPASALGDDDHDHDHERARRAVEAGRALPLPAICERARATFGGTVLDVEIEGERRGRLIYEIKLLGSGGRVLKLRYDAMTGELLGSGGVGDHR